MSFKCQWILEYTLSLSAFIIIIQGACKWFGTAPWCFGKESDCTGDYDHYFVKSTCGDGRHCTTGFKVLCCNVENPYSSLYWKGTAPFCSGECADCNGDDCLGRSQCGDGNFCWGSGRKQLCGRRSSLTKAELEEMVKISEYTKAKEGMAMLMGGHQVDVMEESDPGLVLAYVNYDKVIWEN